MKILYISPNLTEDSFGGSIIARNNLAALRKQKGLRIVSLSVSKNASPDSIQIQTTNGKIFTALSNLLCLCATLNLRGAVNIFIRYYRYRPDIVWLDSSLFGILIPMFKVVNPSVKVVCFFHNIERRLIFDRIKLNKLYLLAYVATVINEYLSVKITSAYFAIQEHDARQIQQDYSVLCTDIIPVAIKDCFISKYDSAGRVSEKRYVLFVGSDFWPNIEALEFLDKIVAPLLVNTKILAIGYGLERYINVFKNMKIRGRVENLQPYYHHAVAIVAPIFSGGGMKVKIAEALMYNKIVISTPFAAIGYEAVSKKIIIHANTAKEFASQIERIDTQTSQEARNYYLKFYSPNVTEAKISKIIKNLNR